MRDGGTLFPLQIPLPSLASLYRSLTDSSSPSFGDPLHFPYSFSCLVKQLKRGKRGPPPIFPYGMDERGQLLLFVICKHLNSGKH